MQSGYYDPCGGVVYGPSVTTKTPTFLSGLKKHKHDEHNCPLCNSNAHPATSGIPAGHAGAEPCCQHGHGSSWSATPTYATPASYGAAFNQPASNRGGHSPSCDCPSTQNCSVGCAGKCSCGKRSQACRGKGQPHCNCSTPAVECNVCDPCQHEFPVSHCDTCSTLGDSFSGYVHEEPFVSDSYSPAYSSGSPIYSSEPMILPGETIIDGESFHGDTNLPETFGHPENCPHCRQSTSGPIFQGTIIPGHEHEQLPAYETDKPTGPAPAPAAEPADPQFESVPGESVSPMPEPGPLPASTTMMIPTFPTPKPARQVHWVPNTLK
tara:strand:+ start:31823 stop:32791 length:969 start_codon:yes stop_codon:yes gene_type:complete